MLFFLCARLTSVATTLISRMVCVTVSRCVCVCSFPYLLLLIALLIVLLVLILSLCSLLCWLACAAPLLMGLLTVPISFQVLVGDFVHCCCPYWLCLFYIPLLPAVFLPCQSHTLYPNY